MPHLTMTRIEWILSHLANVIEAYESLASFDPTGGWDQLRRDAISRFLTYQEIRYQTYDQERTTLLEQGLDSA